MNGRSPATSTIRGVEIPIGVALISVVLFATAIVNLLTKELATIAGVSFSAIFFVVFTITERANAEEHMKGESELEQFRVAAAGGTDRARRWTFAPAASWSRCAIRRISPISSRCFPRRTRPSAT